MVRRVFLFAVSAALALAGEWSAPIDVLHEFQPCVTYKAKVEGDVLWVQATIQPGWHTFAIDNEQRAAEKLAGKPSLGIDMPTKISLGKGLALAGKWHQTAPQDFSKPDIRWFTWGYEKQAVFAAKVKRTGAGSAEIGIKGQACSDSTCKNIDVTLSVPLHEAANGKSSELPWKDLLPVR